LSAPTDIFLSNSAPAASEIVPGNTVMALWEAARIMAGNFAVTVSAAADIATEGSVPSYVLTGEHQHPT
jgi:hypothetical protein